MNNLYHSSWTMIALFLFFLTLFSWIAVIGAYSLPLWPFLLPCVPLLLLGAYLLWWLPIRWREQRERDHRQQQKKALQMLSRYRHDWLNHIQLVQGYLQMKKYERMVGPLRTCVEEAKKHARLSSLSSPLLAYSLMEASLHYPQLQIDIQASALPEHLPLAVEKELAHLLFSMCAKGDEIRQRRGQSVSWTFTLCHRGENGLAIGLCITGENIEEAYIHEVISSLTEWGLVLEGADPVSGGHQLHFYLSYNKKGLRLPKPWGVQAVS